jgi:hypothetical protein
VVPVILPTILSEPVKRAVQEAKPAEVISKTILKEPGRPVGKEAKKAVALLSSSE